MKHCGTKAFIAFLSPTAGGAIQAARADLGMWAYSNSNLARYVEEALAETTQPKACLLV